MSGLFSAFLDNAPTYLFFIKSTHVNACELVQKNPAILKAVSLGSVFMGAMTYIGNAPNLMIRAIVTDHEVPLPSFFGYLVYSTLVLLPVLYVARELT